MSNGNGSSMWEPIVYAEPLDTLTTPPIAFLLLEAKVRPNVRTEFGDRDAVDLVVATTEPGVTRTFGGFAAGIVGQAKRQGPNDLPAVVRIIDTPTPRGQTKALEPVERVTARDAAGLASIAAALPVPIRPLPPEGEPASSPAGGMFSGTPAGA